ncbi:tetratricopeptide repeat protein [Kitasatospora sp. NPDC048365]|uniref:tetratricopeptide repeat protein n=1 Tax=Kitasatospora sp. NPDC048365 TaxID=3364050 RepID=UPI00370FA2B7
MSAEASGERSVAAQSITNAYTGDISSVVLSAEVLNAARDVQAPPGLANLTPQPLCLGRDEDLSWLDTALAADGGTAITQAPALHGLGGIGKTTLALAYAHRRRGTYALVWWLDADTPAGIERSLGALATRLFAAWAGRAGEQERAAWAMAWLQWHPGWLLVFDNVEDPRDLAPYTGALAGGHVIVTSRKATGWPPTTPTRALGLLDPAEAAGLICAYAFPDGTPTPRELRDARDLAADLGHLPLALEQAGAYLRQNPTVTVDAYRRRLPAKLDKAADGIAAERTIARIWTQTLDALTARDPRAVEVLRTLAWLGPDGVPVGLLETPGADNDEVHEALGLLRAYSMAAVGRQTVGVHRLLQAVLRSTAPTGPDGSPAGRGAAEDALVRETLAALDPPAPDALARWGVLLPHIVALAATRPAGRVDRAVDLYVTAAQYLREQGHDARTVPLREAVLAQSEEVHGDLHPDTLTSRNNLAGAYEAAGELERAVHLHTTVLAQSGTVFGDTDPRTLTSRNNLGSVYETAGDPQRAIPLYETVLAQRAEVLGDTHPDTLTSRNNLAGCYAATGDLDRAVPLYEATLRQFEEVLGATDPSTLTSRNNLAHAYAQAGRLDRAIPLYETTLAQCEEVLGDTHPDTLVGRGNLAGAYADAGRLELAIPLYETTLAQREQVLGDTHARTLVSRNNLAHAYARAGDLDRAVPLYETTLAQCELVLGDTHPGTVSVRGNLAWAYRRLGVPEAGQPHRS